MYDIEDAFKKIHEGKRAKFDEAIDVAINLKLEKKHVSTIKGICNLPNGVGRSCSVALISSDGQIATGLDVDKIGGQDFVEEIIKSGKCDFDVLLATADMMPFISKAASILGPKKLMPSPKMGTVVSANNIESVVSELKSGKKLSFKMDKFNIVHARVGSVKSNVEELISNLKVLMSSIMQLKPSDHKGVFLKSVFVNTTMGKSCALNLTSVNNL